MWKAYTDWHKSLSHKTKVIIGLCVLLGFVGMCGLCVAGIETDYEETELTPYQACVEQGSDPYWCMGLYSDK